METSLGGGGPLAHPSQPAVGRFPAGRSAADAAGQCEGAAGEMDSLERRHSAVGGSTGPDSPAAAAPGAEPAAALELAAPAATTPVTLPPLGRSESSTVCLRSPSGAPYLSAGKVNQGFGVRCRLSVGRLREVGTGLECCSAAVSMPPSTLPVAPAAQQHQAAGSRGQCRGQQRGAWPRHAVAATGAVMHLPLPPPQQEGYSSVPHIAGWAQRPANPIA